MSPAERSPVRLTADFSSGTMVSRRKWCSIFRGPAVSLPVFQRVTNTSLYLHPNQAPSVIGDVTFSAMLFLLFFRGVTVGFTHYIALCMGTPTVNILHSTVTYYTSV